MKNRAGKHPFVFGLMRHDAPFLNPFSFISSETLSMGKNPKSNWLADLGLEETDWQAE